MKYPAALSLSLAVAGLAGCATAIPAALQPVAHTMASAGRSDTPGLAGAHPFLLPGQRALAQRTNPQTPRTPFELWESRWRAGWQAPVRLFAELPSAYEPQAVAHGPATHLYFAALPPRSYVPRIYQSRVAGTGAWAEPEKLDLLDQGKGAESPDVVRTTAGTWWMAYASAGPTPDVRLAISTDGRDWQSVARLADGAHPRLAALRDGRLVIAFEQGASVTVRQSTDGRTWQDTLTLANHREPALTAFGTGGLLLATRETGLRRGPAVSWRRSADGRQWSAPQSVPAEDLTGLRWLMDGGRAALYGAPAAGTGKLTVLPVAI